MMTKKFGALFVAGVLAASMSANAVAQDAAANAMVPAGEAAASSVLAPEDAVAARKALMRSNGATMRTAATLTGDEAIAAALTLSGNFAEIPSLFPEGSIVGQTRALPLIWEDWAGFVAISDKGQAAAETALAAALKGDMPAYQAAIGSIGGSCGECHGKFRAPQQ